MKVKLYHTYAFKGQDPAVGYLKDVHEKLGEKNGELAKRTGVSPTTYRSWWKRSNRGKQTKHPQFRTLVATARGLGPEGIEALVKVIRRGK